ncbi:MAG: hypothetical protein ACI4D4_04735 [Lachnospira sp.]
MKKFRNIPAIVTLLVGFIMSIIMIISKYELVEFLWTLVVVMVLFYIASLILCVILNRIFADKDESKEESKKSENDDLKDDEVELSDNNESDAEK